MKFSFLKTKLWFNIFIRVAIIFVVFTLVIALSNISFLIDFFSYKEKLALKEQVIIVSQLDFSDSNKIVSKLSKINEKYNFDVEIYNKKGAILYTTHGSQMMDFFHQNNDKFAMAHEKLITQKRETLSNGVVYEEVIRAFDGNEYLLCRKEISDSMLAEVRVQKQLIANSAAIANEFIIIISVIFLIVAILWVFIFARQFSQPIMQMNEITKNMSELNFERKLTIDRKDEIGQLAVSVNNLSDTLSEALSSLKATNEKLRDEIELEHQLDVMRRGFVANVSHELKTPISIISGYAEGLKLNINSSSKDEYCDTIIEESQRMNRLVLSILELSRYESGQIQLNKKVFDISVVTADMLKRIFKTKNIDAVCNIPEKTLVFADELQIEQVLKSFLENALVHTPECGKVTVFAEQTNNTVKITVYNTGSHIDETLMPEIWQSFYRGDKSRKREKSRFGLGLSIVAAIMKLHEKRCGVYNTTDGVCFWFELPLAEDNNII